MDPLPIDALLPEAVEVLGQGGSLVVEAPPGAGKTTRLPRALFEAGLAGRGEVVVLEPRRLAARMAARRVAEEMGERPGTTVGWQVRFEDVTGPRTRLRYVTEALFTRRLLGEPTLPGVGLVVLDEFHERHLDSDLALALVRRLRSSGRPDLRLLVMSATLDAEPVARFLGAPRLTSEGRAFEVAIEYLSPEEMARARPLEDLVVSAVRRLLKEEPDGHLLCFLPGAAEIRRALEGVRALPAVEAGDLLVLPLHGDLPAEDQDLAVRPSRRRKIILATNVAESSVTVDGVVAVIDSGLARVASHSPWSGLPVLELRRVSRAAAAQRAGRAGRTRAGRCLRLYTRHDHDARPAFEVPEILREDLSEMALVLGTLGARDLAFLEPPKASALEAAFSLLRQLGALDGEVLTPLGQRLVRFPLHPRLARLVTAAEDAGEGEAGALLAALIGERDIRERFRPGDRDTRYTGHHHLTGGADEPSAESDLFELADLFGEAAHADFAPGVLRSLHLVPAAVQAVERARRQIARLVRASGGHAGHGEEGLSAAVLAAFPDRVARRRAKGSDDLMLVGGGSAKLARESTVREAPLLVAVAAEARRSQAGPVTGSAPTLVRLASAITTEMLLDLFPDSLRYESEVRFVAEAERVDGFERLLYRDLVLSESRSTKLDADLAAAALYEAALARGVRTFAPEGTLDRLVARLNFVARQAPHSGGLSAPDETTLKAALRDACQGRRSFAELRQAGIEEALLAALPPAQRAALERLAPQKVTLPGGRKVEVIYEPGDKPPFIQSRLQDFFGMAEGPRLAEGRVPLVLHLLAPNRRAVQVTTDLRSFWSRHYGPLRRELMRRYPRHAWPEDPLAATPPQRR